MNPEVFMEYIRSKTSGEGKDYLLLDEVQLLNYFELVLNGYLCKDKMDVYVTIKSYTVCNFLCYSSFSGGGA